MHNGHDLDRARDALRFIPPDLPRGDWVKVGMAVHAAGLPFDEFDAWSAGAGNYDARAARDMWRSIKPGKGITEATLYRMAAEHGDTRISKAQRRPAKAPGRHQAAPARAGAGISTTEIWARCKPATADHAYIAAKQGASDGLRVVPDDDPLTIAGHRMAGALVVPVVPLAGGEPVSLQFIPPPGAGMKLNLPGPMGDGAFIVGDLVAGGTVYLCEGIGQAWACWKATDCPAVVCFGWGRVRGVAAELRQRDASARLVLVPDVGKEQQAETIAREVAGLFVTMPEGWPINADVNDLARRDGLDVLDALLGAARHPSIESSLSVVFADELPDTFTPPDEVVQGVLTAGDGSVLYGDSNSGKTFFVIDLAAAVARGAPWMGRRTEPGMVVYLAAESPASVRRRLQAYQRHHGLKVPNFAIVQSPIDLFDGDADTDAVIQLVRQLETQRGQSARLIVGDTLARLSAGANENAGQDMGLVVRRFDRIRSECKAHFLLIHHSGKAAAGARGWSGVRAAVDTEIEVTYSPAGWCAEITKQRDVNTKGERIGFRLDTVILGQTKWGVAATSCVVVPADAPERQTGKRIGEVGGAILEVLCARGTGMKKREVVKHFDGRYDKSAVYRELKRLVEGGQVHESVGIVAAAKGEVRNGAN